MIIKQQTQTMQHTQYPN